MKSTLDIREPYPRPETMSVVIFREENPNDGSVKNSDGSDNPE
jgi:hypothetical protein